VGVIDEYSLATVPLEMFFDDTPLSLGTGFVMAYGGRHYLMTNWHNFSGKNPKTGKHLSSTLAEPNRLRVHWNVKDDIGSRFIQFMPIRDAEGRPLWAVHGKYGNKVDIAALPIELPPNVDPRPINGMPAYPLELAVGHDVFVLGYPFGIGTNAFPIWKRGSLASEPAVIPADDPHMLIDTASRPGMSGSPVIRRTWNMHKMEDGGVQVDGGPGTRLLGIYSGRLTTNDPLDAQLGMVWPAFLIDQLLSGGKQDI
jgi:hypothetical protein